MEDKSSPEVSVIIPFFNAPRLGIAIKSILGQTFQNFELILIDNLSDDNSPEVARKYALLDSRIRFVKEESKGVVWAMNKGVEESKGAYIMRMDGDDYSFPERIEQQLEAFRKDTSLGVVSGLVEYEGEEKNIGFRLYVDWMNQILENDEIRNNQFVEFPLANPSLMFKKELFKKVGLFRDGDFPEDYEFFLRLQSHHVKMQKVNQKVLKWHDSPTRLTRTDTRYSHEAFYKVKAKYLAGWLRINNPFHPDVYIWGAGRVSRRRSDYLLEYGIRIVQYIDVKKQSGVLYFEDIPVNDSCFIVSFVANRGAREEIRSFLISRNYQEAENFILAS